MKYLIVFLMAFSGSVYAGEWSLLAGVSRFNKPIDGNYWNLNQPNAPMLTPAAAGFRYDEKSWAVQYTHFGRVTMDGIAVTVDAPFAGGYIPGTGTCVGTCAELARWKMESETQSIAFMGVKRFGAWSIEGGVNVYEIRTKGHVLNLDGSKRFQYKEARALDVGPVAGVAYHRGPWSARLNVWRMEGKSIPGDGYIPPATFGEDFQMTAMLGYTFK